MRGAGCARFRQKPRRGLSFQPDGSASGYYVAGQRIAMRVGAPGQEGTLTYLHGDHLGSTSLATNGAGEEVYRRGYHPFGEERYGTGVAVTDYGFTAQREEAGFGLYDYNARYYDPQIGRLVTADTIVSSPGNPQSFNRYAYVANNPLTYVDPSGHIMEGQAEEAQNRVDQLQEFGITIDVDRGFGACGNYIHGYYWGWKRGAWELWELDTVLKSVRDLAAKIAGRDNAVDLAAEDVELFHDVVGHVWVRRSRRLAPGEGPNGLTLGRQVTLYDGGFIHQWTGERKDERNATVVHEIAHVWDFNAGVISWAIADDTRGSMRPTTRAEDNLCECWAEMVATWVYPEHSRQHPDRRGLSADQADFVARAVQGAIPPMPMNDVVVWYLIDYLQLLRASD
jgi:RHS repeat-associated protein